MRLVIPLFIMLAMMVGTAVTFPRLSLEQSTACANCHLDPSGAGMRTEYGNYAVALNELTLPSTKALLVKKYRKPRIAEGLTVGFDSRHLVFDDGRVFRMQTDAYLNFEPFKDFHYFMRIGEIGITENYALLSFQDKKYNLKAGRFYPAFGLRNADHKAFNRERTGHGSNLYLDGLSAAANFNDFNLTAEIFDSNNRAIYGLHLYKTASLNSFGLLAGGSLRFSEEIDDSHGTFPQAKSLFGGINYDRFSLMGEIDLVGDDNDTLITYLNLTTRVEYGLYLIGEYNFFDGDRDIINGVDEFFRFSIEFYPIPFFQLRPSYTYYTEGYLKDESDLFLQVHFGY